MGSLVEMVPPTLYFLIKCTNLTSLTLPLAQDHTHLLLRSCWQKHSLHDGKSIALCCLSGLCAVLLVLFWVLCLILSGFLPILSK